MGKLFVSVGGGGADTDVVTASAGDVLAGKVIVGPDGEPLTGTLALSGNATAAQVLSGKTFYNTDAKTILTGTMANQGAQTKTYTPSTSAQTYTIPAGYHNGSGKVTCAAIPSGYVNIGGTWTVFNQGTFAANMAFVPNLRVKYSWNMETVGPALSYGNRTYGGVTKYGLYMPGWDNYNNDGVPCAVFNRAIDFSLFKTMYVDVYDSLEQTAVFDVVFMDLTTKKSVSGVSTYGRTPDTGIGFFTLTIDLSSINTMYYFGIGSRRSGNYLFNIRLVHV